jgi:hypothetical protein
MTDQPAPTQRLFFTQRYGLTPGPTVLSYKDISKELWVDLFNTLQRICSEVIRKEDLAEEIWMHFHHEPISDYPCDSWGDALSIGQLVNYTRESLDHESLTCSARVYDLIEFVYNTIFLMNHDRQSLQQNVNEDFARNFASVKMIDGLIAPVSDEEQSHAIEAAMQGPLADVNSQVHTALALLADREHPIYRDSVKNSISAVESLCKHIVGDSRLTLEDALKKVGPTAVPVHPTIKDAFRKLYAYAGDVARHGLMGSDNLDVEDARYMLVTCSAFINYLVVKANKAGIRL